MLKCHKYPPQPGTQPSGPVHSLQQSKASYSPAGGNPHSLDYVQFCPFWYTLCKSVTNWITFLSAADLQYQID